jgi:hypothetical protein
MIVTVAFVPKLFDHEYVPPPVAVLLTDVVVQVKFVVPVMPALGTLLSSVTFVVAVALQPLLFVTVTV